MTYTEPKTLVRRLFEEVFNAQNTAAAAEIIAARFIAHHPLGPIRGPEGVLQTIGMFRSGFPDLRYEIEDMVADGDLVAARWTARGTQHGAFMTIPPQEPPVVVVVTGIDFIRVHGQQLAEAWVSTDLLGLFQQLGAVSKPGQIA
jgi:predicted ester cyclase